MEIISQFLKNLVSPKPHTLTSLDDGIGWLPQAPAGTHSRKYLLWNLSLTFSRYKMFRKEMSPSLTPWCHLQVYGFSASECKWVWALSNSAQLWISALHPPTMWLRQVCLNYLRLLMCKVGILCQPHWDGAKIKLVNEYKRLSNTTWGKVNSRCQGSFLLSTNSQVLLCWN